MNHRSKPKMKRAMNVDSSKLVRSTVTLAGPIEPFGADVLCREFLAVD